MLLNKSFSSRLRDNNKEVLLGKEGIDEKNQSNMFDFLFTVCYLVEKNIFKANEIHKGS